MSHAVCLSEPLRFGATRITGPKARGTPLRYRPYISRTREIRLAATLPLLTIRDRSRRNDSTVSLSDPQAVRSGTCSV